MLKRILLSIVVLGVAALFHGRALSQSYPTKPIRFIVPWPPGGVADITTRLVGRKLGENMGQSLIVDNRAGATGIIGCELAAHAPPDGYTLVMGTTTTHATNPVIFKKLP
jgi:tripartite-type tricarboxylate transporter receptor subunit TctC